MEIGAITITITITITAITGTATLDKVAEGVPTIVIIRLDSWHWGLYQQSMLYPRNSHQFLNMTFRSKMYCNKEGYWNLRWGATIVGNNFSNHCV